MTSPRRSGKSCRNAGLCDKPRPTLTSDSYINDWHIQGKDRLGRIGRFFTVFRDENPDRLFALKLLREDRLETDRRTIEREAERIRAAKAPDHMPAFIEKGTWLGLPYFVMELLDDVDYPIQPRDYRAYCVGAFEALAALHRADILHCDITPLHLVRKNGHYAFIDFDNARGHFEAADARRCVGTDPYIAPEVAREALFSEQSDIFSLARVLHEHCPKKRLMKCFGPVLMQAMDPDPKDRPGSAAELAERLRTCRAPHRRLLIVCGTLLIGFVSFVVGMAGVGMFRYESTVSRYRPQIDVKARFNAALQCLKDKDFDGAEELLETIAGTECPLRDQAVHILEDIDRQRRRFGMGKRPAWGSKAGRSAICTE